MSAKYKIGDKVKWTSQVAGWPLSKAGVIVEIVASGALPSTEIKHGTGGCGRKHESYVVSVTAVGKGPRFVRRPPRAYWPIASKLRPWNGEAIDEVAS